MRKYLFLVLLWHCSVLLAQEFTQGQRTEIVSRNRLNAWRVALLPHAEVLTYQAEDESFFSRQKKWFFRKYDQNLDLKWQKEWQTSPKLAFLSNAYDRNHFFMLYGSYKKEEYEIFDLDLTTGEYTKYDFFAIKKFAVDFFEVMDSLVFVGGIVKNTPLVLRLDLRTQKSRVLPTSLDLNSQLVALEKDKINGLIYVASIQEKNRQTRLFVKAFDTQGTLQESTELMTEEGMNLITAKISFVDKNEFLIIGTYAQNNLDIAQGVYVAKFKDKKMSFLKYYNFAELKNFYSYLPENQQEKIKQKQEKKQAKGKNLNIRYHLLVHEPRKFEDNYLFVAEAYYPVYRTEDQMNWAMNRRWVMPTNTRVLDGFVYTHALWLNFDQDGKLIFDQTHEIKNVKLQNLQRLVSTEISNDSLRFLYNHNGKVQMALYRKDQLLEKKERYIKPLLPSEQLRFSTESKSGYWFKNNFLIWGYQNVRSEQRKQSVFYLNKVVWD